MKKKSFIIILLFSSLFLPGLLQVNKIKDSYINNNKLKVSQQSTLIIGTMGGLFEIDPLLIGPDDILIYNVIEQVCEGLFSLNCSDPSNSIIPRLALDYGYWSNNGLNYTVSLRQDVIFHDETQFNATSVKWNFDRLAYFMNYTGEIDDPNDIPFFRFLYQWYEGMPIILCYSIYPPTVAIG